MITLQVVCTPPSSCSYFESVKRPRIFAPAGTGEVKRTLLRP